MVADIEELETMHASEVYSKRLKSKEVIFPKENGKFHFPVADGRIKFVGGDQELRTSTLIREHKFHSIYSIGRETSGRTYVVWVGTDKTAVDTHTTSFMARTLDQNGKKC